MTNQPLISDASAIQAPITSKGESVSSPGASHHSNIPVNRQSNCGENSLQDRDLHSNVIPSGRSTQANGSHAFPQQQNQADSSTASETHRVDGQGDHQGEHGGGPKNSFQRCISVFLKWFKCEAIVDPEMGVCYTPLPECDVAELATRPDNNIASKVLMFALHIVCVALNLVGVFVASVFVAIMPAAIGVFLLALFATIWHMFTGVWMNKTLIGIGLTLSLIAYIVLSATDFKFDFLQDLFRSNELYRFVMVIVEALTGKTSDS